MKKKTATWTLTWSLLPYGAGSLVFRCIHRGKIDSLFPVRSTSAMSGRLNNTASLMPRSTSIVTDKPVLALYLAIGITIVTTFVIAFVRLSKSRVLLGDVVMFFVRALALTIGWMFVAALYLPIQLFNVWHPFIPYDSSKEEMVKKNKIDRSIYAVSDYDFSQRFASTFAEDDDQ